MVKQRTTKALVVSPNDKQGKLAQVVQDVYHDTCWFELVEFTSSLRKAINSIVEEEFEICFISHAFPLDDVRAFFVDYGNIEKRSGCGFVQVHPEIKPETDIVGPQTLGFHAVVSEKGTHDDKEQLTEALQEFLFEAEIVKRKYNVDSALNVVLRKIDTAARDLKRGIKKKIDSLPAEFIEIQTEFDQEVLEGYFEKLETKTEDAEPENAQKLNVPEAILKKDLPKLDKNRYMGASNRVWKKLLRKHGATDDSPPKEDREELTTDTDESPLPNDAHEETLEQTE